MRKEKSIQPLKTMNTELYIKLLKTSDKNAFNVD